MCDGAATPPCAYLRMRIQCYVRHARSCFVPCQGPAASASEGNGSAKTLVTDMRASVAAGTRRQADGPQSSMPAASRTRRKQPHRRLVRGAHHQRGDGARDVTTIAPRVYRPANDDRVTRTEQRLLLLEGKPVLRRMDADLTRGRLPVHPNWQRLGDPDVAHRERGGGDPARGDAVRSESPSSLDPGQRVAPKWMQVIVTMSSVRLLQECLVPRWMMVSPALSRVSADSRMA